MKILKTLKSFEKVLDDFATAKTRALFELYRISSEISSENEAFFSDFEEEGGYYEEETYEDREPIQGDLSWDGTFSNIGSEEDLGGFNLFEEETPWWETSVSNGNRLEEDEMEADEMEDDETEETTQSALTLADIFGPDKNQTDHYGKSIFE